MVGEMLSRVFDVDDSARLVVKSKVSNTAINTCAYIFFQTHRDAGTQRKS